MVLPHHRILILWTAFTLIASVCPASANTTVTNTTKLNLSDFSEKHSETVPAKKTVKKKAFGLPNKPASSSDELNLFESLGEHPAGFDFNLDDLEDVHENFKKGDLSDEEQQLLRDADLALPSTVPNIVREPILRNNDSRQHVYKVTKTSKQKDKSFSASRKDEFQKHSGLRFNGFDSPGVAMGNGSVLHSNSSYNSFPLLVSLYDHFHWEPSEIRNKVSAACGVELYAYLAALSNNVEWAQRAYDSSGHYRGQILYGNDLWLGEKVFCYEINYHINPSEREKFAFGFFIARIAIKNFPGSKEETKVLNLGECLPKSCSAKDVQTILELDPHSKIIQQSMNSEDSFQMQILSVRKVPGDYIIWNDMAFYVLCSIFIIVLIISVASTVYQNQIESGQVSRAEKLRKHSERQDAENGKTFELFQMQTHKSVRSVCTNNNNGSKADEDKGDSNAMSRCKSLERNITKNCNGNEICKTKLGIASQILLCFSLRDNAKAIFAEKKNTSENKLLSSMHGLRAVTLFWTILVHTYLFLFNVGENKYRRVIYERSLLFQLVGNATFSVDTFFFISGVLVTYLFVKQEKPADKSTRIFAKRGARETLLLVSYRYLRLTPAYLFVIFFNRIALEYVLNESVFTPYPIDYPSCRTYWWRNILYINNWYPFSEFCMHWSWYMANDMQFYIMAIILLIISRRHLKLSIAVLVVFLCTSWATSGIVSLHFNYVFKLAKPLLSFDILYDKPWQRIGTYILGMMTGYIIYRVKTPPRVPPAVNASLWLCTFGIFFALIFGVWNGQLGLLTTAFYVGVGHTAWAVGLVWITLSCCWGLCRPLNAFFSYSGFLPVSRLTYCTYLVHPIIISIVTFHMAGPLNLQHPVVVALYMGFATLSCIAGFVLSVLFEAPVIKLLKILFHR